MAVYEATTKNHERLYLYAVNMEAALTYASVTLEVEVIQIKLRSDIEIVVVS